MRVVRCWTGGLVAFIAAAKKRVQQKLIEIRAENDYEENALL